MLIDEREGEQQEVHGNMTIPQALCVCACVTKPMAGATGCWYEGKRFKSGQDVCVYM